MCYIAPVIRLKFLVEIPLLEPVFELCFSDGATIISKASL